MNLNTLLTIGIIVLVFYLFFCNCSTEHFKAKSKSKSTNSIKGKAKKATKIVTKKVSKNKKIPVKNTQMMNTISNVKRRERQTRKMIDSLNNLKLNIDESIEMLTRRIEQMPSRIRLCNEKKVFTNYLIKKTQAKITYINNLVTLGNNLSSSKTFTSMKQVVILKRIVEQQLVAIRVYIAKTRSYIAQTTSLFIQLDESHNNIVSMFADLQERVKRYNTLLVDTRKNITDINKLFETTNTMIENSSPTQSEDEEETEEKEVEEFTQGLSIFEQFFNVTGSTSEISQFEMITLDATEINIPATLTVPAKTTIPKLGATELVLPTFNETPITNFLKIQVTIPKNPTDSSESLMDTQIETDLITSLPIEPVVEIPTDVEQSDIEAENELIYEFS